MFTTADQAAFDSAFGKPVTAKLNGIAVATFPGILKVATGYPEGADTRELLTRHYLSVAAGYWSGLTRNHTLTIDGTEYKIYGQPEPRNDGRLTIHLTRV